MWTGSVPEVAYTGPERWAYLLVVPQSFFGVDGVVPMVASLNRGYPSLT